METIVSGKQLPVIPNLIARLLHYARLGTHDRPYLLRDITRFDVDLFANTMCTNLVPMGGFMSKEFTPGKLKPEYALMNKVIHNMIGPKGKEKLPSKEEIQFLYQVMNGKVVDYALVIWFVMRDFLRSTTENRHIPFPTLVTTLVEATGIRGLCREKRALHRLGPIHKHHRSKKSSRFHKASVSKSFSGYFWAIIIFRSWSNEYISFKKDGA